MWSEEAKLILSLQPPLEPLEQNNLRLKFHPQPFFLFLDSCISALRTPLPSRLRVEMKLSDS